MATLLSRTSIRRGLWEAKKLTHALKGSSLSETCALRLLKCRPAQTDMNSFSIISQGGIIACDLRPENLDLKSMRTPKDQCPANTKNLWINLLHIGWSTPQRFEVAGLGFKLRV
ncbi:predicted protein [Histoplasma capsulatum var. duboisii H88]|uniref:Predicted protein n=2 Tax=Ajellomyces capsulatus TaxID=5037 RepID=F0UWA8_AJEC8|nr:predicted protein [Histoplasma capsulatum H143]EGC42618.1 predicted protein [Histoplasma capsulatum var. duboisii H88]